MELNGKIKVIKDTQEVGASFKKRELVLTTEEQYPQDILIEFTQDKCAILDHFKVGDNVTIAINIRGREWVNPQGETKYFNSIQGWKIARENFAPPKQQAPHDQFEPLTNFNEKELDDLPY